ncbi:MAG TPA: glycosyltransferase family 61 protein [Pyrinomonadaceae bacterium]
MFRPYPTPHEGAPLLREGGAAVRVAPANLRAGDEDVFAHERERVIPPTRLVELHDVSATPEGMLFKGASILPESFSSPVMMRRFLARRRSVLKFFARNRLLRRRRRITEPCLWVTDDWSGGYFHWLADALPRLYAAREAARDVTLLLPHGFERLEFVTSSLKLFPVRRVEYVGADEVCVCERLLLPTHTAPSGHYNEPLVRELRDFLLEGFGAARAGAGGGARLYVSRGRAPKRRLTNEAEVARVVEEFGFRVVHFEEHPFAEQVRLAASAAYLVSNHGAGLTNVLFMPEGGSVLELRREGERERNWFFNLASAVGVRYYYQLCAPADGDAHSGDLTADVGTLRENLALMLGRDGRG